MGDLKRVPGNTNDAFDKGGFFDYEGVWYFHAGLYQLWTHFCDVEDWGRDPPKLKKELQDWLDHHGVDRERLEKKGILEIIFHDPTVFTLFRLTWL